MSTFGCSESYRRPELETTQWEDIHGTHKTEGYEYVAAIKAERTRKKNEDWTPADVHHDDNSTEHTNQNATSLVDRLLGTGEQKSDDDFDSDDEEDEAFFRKFREQRIAEMKAKKANEKYGCVRYINRAEYVSEVAEASKACWVVLHLYQDRVPECTLMERALAQVAKQKKATKFLKIKSTDCIENFPDSSLPCLLVYHEGKMQMKFEGLGQFGGRKMTARDVEWRLAEVGACPTDMEENPRVEEVIKDVMESAIQQDLDD